MRKCFILLILFLSANEFEVMIPEIFSIPKSENRKSTLSQDEPSFFSPNTKLLEPTIEIPEPNFPKLRCDYKNNFLESLGVSEVPSSIVYRNNEGKIVGAEPHPINIIVDDSNVRKISETKRKYLLEVVVSQGIQILKQKIQVSSQGWIDQSDEIVKRCHVKGVIDVPLKYQQKPTIADFIIFLGTREAKADGSLAFAYPCYQETGTMRPLAAFVIFNPYYLEVEKPRVNLNIATFVHEALHGLVFSDPLYVDFPLLKDGQEQFFYDKQGNFFMRGPNLLKVVKEYFGCKKVDRVPLENEGNSGSKGSHFEKLIFRHDLMISGDFEKPIISIFMLALMKDSGWYEVDFSQADYMTWGRGENCHWFESDCKLSNIRGVEEICVPGHNMMGCDKTFRYGTSCVTSDIHTNGCRLNILKKDRLCSNTSSSVLFDFETLSEGSRCQEFRLNNKKRSACVKVECHKNKDSYIVFLKDTKKNSVRRHRCEFENQVHHVAKELVFFCENPQIICNSLCPNNCNDRGTCQRNGRCSCERFYSGIACEKYIGCPDLPSVFCQNLIKNNNLSTQNFSESDQKSVPNSVFFQALKKLPILDSNLS